MGSNYTNETISQRLDFTEWNKEKWKDFGEACFYVRVSFKTIVFWHYSPTNSY